MGDFGGNFSILLNCHPVHCECTEPGYVAVFLVKDDSGELILMPQKPIFSRILEYK